MQPNYITIDPFFTVRLSGWYPYRFKAAWYRKIANGLKGYVVSFTESNGLFSIHRTAEALFTMSVSEVPAKMSPDDPMTEIQLVFFSSVLIHKSVLKGESEDA